MNIDRSLEVLTITLWVLYGLYFVPSLIYRIRHGGWEVTRRFLWSFRIVIPVLILLGAQFLSAALIFIYPQQVGVVISLLEEGGIRRDPLPAGLHMKLPLVEQVVMYPIYWQTYTMSGTPAEGDVKGNDTIIARTSDGQEVLLDSSIVFRLDGEKVVPLHIDWQDRYISDFIRPLVRSVVRSRVSAFTVDEVNSDKRQDLEFDLNLILAEELAHNGLILDQFLLRNIAFSPEYGAAVEQKQVAQQGAEESGHQAEAIRTLAAAEADALGLIEQELDQNEELLTYRYIEKLAPNINVMLLPNDAPFLLPLPTMVSTPILTTTQTAPETEATPMPSSSEGG